MWAKLVPDDLSLRLRWRVEAQVSRVTLPLSWGGRAVLSRVRPESGLANRPRQSCFLCTTWRTGSTFLGDTVRAAADLDLSREPFYLRRQQASLGAVLRGRSLLLYLDRVVVAPGTNQHGIFGTKAMWADFRSVLHSLRAIPEFRSLGELEVLRSVFPEPVFLFLTRRDKLRQAISFYRAKTSRVWHRDDSGRLYITPGPDRVDPEYDYVRIRAVRETIRRQEEEWRDFFHRNGIQPLEMTYEEVCENLPALVGRILEQLGHHVPDERLGRARSKYVKLADLKTEEWVERFRSDSGEAMSPPPPERAGGARKSLGLRRHFLVIGAQRSGTTWLYRNLRRHPDIWLPPAKEVHFFDRSPRYPTPSYHASPPGWARLSLVLTPSPIRDMVRRYAFPWEWFRAAERHPWSALWFSLSYPFATIDPGWYRRLFSLGGEKITGDLTPGYSLLNEEDVAVARELLPEARIVMVLRNPIERAWSNFKLDCRMRGIRVDDAWAADLFFRRPDVFMRGDYASILSRWRRHFGKDRLHVGYYEDLVEDPEGFLRSILRFLGARTDVSFPDLRQRVNKSIPVHPPEEIRKTLARQYRDGLRELCDMEPGRAEVWLREAEEIPPQLSRRL